MEQTPQSLGDGSEGAEECTRSLTAIRRVTEGRRSGELLAELAHDARNMVAALSLYCDLLQQPGVLVRRFAHYAGELRLVTAASRGLVEKMAELEYEEKCGNSGREQEMDRDFELVAANELGALSAAADGAFGLPITNLTEELLANRNLLAALAGPSISLTMEAEGGGQQVWITGEDLTRVLVNLVKNAAEAMPEGGRIRISVSERQAETGSAQQVLIAVEDSGPGIPEELLDRIFDRGYSTRATTTAEESGRPAAVRGLGLAISRSIVETAGGRLVAMNRRGGGVRLEMELPMAAGCRRPPSHRVTRFVVS